MESLSNHSNSVGNSRGVPADSNMFSNRKQLGLKRKQAYPAKIINGTRYTPQELADLPAGKRQKLEDQSSSVHPFTDSQMNELGLRNQITPDAPSFGNLTP